MSLCTKAVDGLQYSWDLVKTGFTKLAHAHDWTGKKISNLTFLPKPVASTLGNLYSSIPTMVPLLLLPRFYTDYFVKPIAMMMPATTIREEFGEQAAYGYYAGIRNACLIHVAMDTVLLIATKNPWLAVPIVSNLYIAAIAHLHANPAPIAPAAEKKTQ